VAWRDVASIVAGCGRRSGEWRRSRAERSGELRREGEREERRVVDGEVNVVVSVEVSVAMD